MEKQKITEIREHYKIRRRSGFANGEQQYKEVTGVRFKNVNYVDGWPRFGAFLLDIVFILIFEAIVGGSIGLVLGLTDNLNILESRSFDTILKLLTYLVIRPMYYIIFEGSIQASPAKLIMGRVVVNEYGEKPSVGQIVARSYIRMIPFEAFSCLSNVGWHDTWSKTYVLRKVDLQDLLLTIKLQEYDRPIVETEENDIEKTDS
jgi:uncharacterized RDD family membrane protein YckC